MLLVSAIVTEIHEFKMDLDTDQGIIISSTKERAIIVNQMLRMKPKLTSHYCQEVSL